jgi:hypothetical protein
VLKEPLVLHDRLDPIPPVSFLRSPLYCPAHCPLSHYYLSNVLVDREDKLAQVDNDACAQDHEQCLALWVSISILTDEICQKQ